MICGILAPTVSHQQSSPTEVPQMAPAFLYEPSLTSIQLRQDNLKNLKDNDDYWEKRVKNLQKNHEEIKKVMETEYEKAMNEVSGKKNAEDSLKQLTSIPCGADRAKIIACYKKYKNEPMRCAKEVQEFADCVDRSTVMIASK